MEDRSGETAAGFQVEGLDVGDLKNIYIYITPKF